MLTSHEIYVFRSCRILFLSDLKKSRLQQQNGHLPPLDHGTATGTHSFKLVRSVVSLIFNK